jgi:hypothetical protein
MLMGPGPSNATEEQQVYSAMWDKVSVQVQGESNCTEGIRQYIKCYVFAHGTLCVCRSAPGCTMRMSLDS